MPAAILLVCGGAVWIIRFQIGLTRVAELRTSWRPKWRWWGRPGGDLSPASPAALLRAGTGSLVGRQLVLSGSKIAPARCGAEFLRRASREGRSPVAQSTSLCTARRATATKALTRKSGLSRRSYYNREGPFGRIFQALQPRRPLAEIGVLGLGAGTDGRLRPARRADHVL